MACGFSALGDTGKVPERGGEGRGRPFTEGFSWILLCRFRHRGGVEGLGLELTRPGSVRPPEPLISTAPGMPAGRQVLEPRAVLSRETPPTAGPPPSLAKEIPEPRGSASETNTCWPVHGVPLAPPSHGPGAHLHTPCGPCLARRLNLCGGGPR